MYDKPVVDEGLGVLSPSADRAVFANSIMFHNTVTGESKEDTQVGAVISVHDLSEM